MGPEAMVERAAIPAWRTQIDTARQCFERGAWLLAQQSEPAIDLAASSGSVRAGIAAIYDALDARSDRLDGVRRATQQLDAICAALAADPTGACDNARATLQQARAALDAVEALLAKQPMSPAPPEAGPVMASGDKPRRHLVDRASLAPEVTLASPPPPPPDEPLEPLVPVTFEELEANIAMLKMRAEERREMAALKKRPRQQTEVQPPEIPAGFAPDIPERVSEVAYVKARTRDMLEEVAMVGLQRAPLFGDPWRIALGLEQRMGRAIDAIAAMGPVALSSIEAWAMDSPVKDSTRMFAVAMTMGCFDGEDALGVIERVYRELVSVEESCREGLVAALTLAPHEGLETWMRRWLVDTDPMLRAIAVEVMGFRGWADDNELATAALDEPVVARRALVPLARQAPRTALDVLEDPLGSGDAALRRAAWRAMVLAHRGRSSSVLREAMADETAADEDRALAAQLMAISGDESDARHLLDAMQAAPTVDRVDAVGWTGLVTALGPLIELLEHDDEAVGRAAGRALDRITGAELREEAEVMAEDIFVPEPPDPDVGEPPDKRLVWVTSDPRDLPPEPATETVEQASTHPGSWRAWVKEHAADWSARLRYRQGKPYTPATSLHELDVALRDVSERRALIDELVIQTGTWVRMDPHDYVVDQLASIERWRAPAQRASSQPGRWDRASRR